MVSRRRLLQAGAVVSGAGSISALAQAGQVEFRLQRRDARGATRVEAEFADPRKAGVLVCEPETSLTSVPVGG